MIKNNTEKEKSQDLNLEDKALSSKTKKQLKKFKKNKNEAVPISHAGRKRSDEERYQ